MVWLVEAVDQVLLSAQTLFREWMWPLLRVWWWALLPLVLFDPARDGWLLWRRTKAFREREYIMLEFVLPHDIIKPIKAMEDVFSSLYAVTFQHSPGYKRDKWLGGETTKFTTFSLEMVGDSGRIRFFMRVEKSLKDQVSSIIHAQYPDVEIKEVEDYTELVPQDVPNEEWELESRTFKLAEDDTYPIKTYRDFFEDRPEAKEEKRVDPLARLFESFSRLNEGEQIWLQFNLTNDDNDWKEEAEKLRDELAKRETEDDKKEKPILQEAAEFVAFGVREEEAEEESGGGMSPEKVLTPGEKETVADIDRKMSKSAFKCSARFVYLARRENMDKAHMGFPFAFIHSLSKGPQYFGVHTPSSTGVKSLIKSLDEQRAFLKKRAAFDAHKMRVNPTFPDDEATFILSAEELATIFHFPGQMAAPGPAVERLQYKRGGPPPGLPTE